MRVTIFGATGLLGKALMREWQGDEVFGLGSRDADIRSPRQVTDAVRRTRPEWIVLAAAYTDVDGCETNHQLAFDVNCRGAGHVAEAARLHGSRLLFLSTDYVFDGKKSSPYETSDARAPRSVYGKSKAEAEVQLGEVLPQCCILRTSWLFGVGGRCFPDTILKLAATRAEIDVVNDQRGCPTYAPDLARAIVQFCHRGAEGVVHATNHGECSWFEFAQEIVRGAGLNTLVRPTTSDKFVRPAERPRYSVLSGKSLEKYGIAMPDWQDALQRYLRERQSGSKEVPTHTIPPDRE
ncbi:MAG TPA: dTDP-4-dehydrorhamnose reductase [Terriglobales bacterium]|jgi:dTDP-4-dehydrorhamnose reductase|nr:dTDP-4-dehydrorhamnose reductase [Terriglobales bacterium]